MNDVFVTMDQTQIADYLAKKVFDRQLEPGYDIMLKNKQLYSVSDYNWLVKTNKISSGDAFVYISFINFDTYESYNIHVEYLFPLIDIYGIDGIWRSYLAKLGFYDTSYYTVYPATGLKYFSVVRLLSDRLVVEFTDINTMATNTGLKKIVVEVLGKGILTQKEISEDQIREIKRKLQKQILPAGHNLYEVYQIINSYYEDRDTTLAKDALDITNAYNRIFQPYRVVYDTKTRQQVLM